MMGIAMKEPCVYIVASHRNGTLHVGVTSDLRRWVFEHKSDAVEGFTKRYAIHRLVHVEFHETMLDAIAREKRLKSRRRAWKLALIERGNPAWRDLYDEIL
jgi:putative endonuclease